MWLRTSHMMRGTQEGKLSRVVWVGLLLLSFFAVRVVQSFVALKNQDTRMALFEPFMDEYLSLQGLPVSEAGPYLRGKLVTIDTTQRAVDGWTYPKLSDRVRAAGPGEVGTVGLITWGWKPAGAYVNQETQETTGQAFVSIAELTLLDLAQRRVVGRTTFEGEPPAGGLTREGDYRSERPMFKIIEYLEQLPRN